LTIADQGVDPVGQRAALQGVDDRNSSAATGFKRDAGILAFGQAKEFRPAHRQQAFVGG